jgi:diamine N-acetyltransferase
MAGDILDSKQNAISLRLIERKDAQLIADWYNDSETARYMSTLVRCKYHTKDKVEKEIDEIDLDYERLFMVMEEGNPVPIGHAGIDDMDQHDRRGEIYFLIGDKKAKGKGYGKLIVRALLEYAFAELSLNMVCASVTIGNKPSMAVIEKSGFRKVGIMREYNYIKDVGFLDEAFYDITLADWKQMKEKNEGNHEHNK